jgi:hypothetical protein
MDTGKSLDEASRRKRYQAITANAECLGKLRSGAQLVILRMCIDQVTHLRHCRSVTVQLLFQLTVCLGLPIMLAQVLRPGLHQEYLQIMVRNREIFPTDTRRRVAAYGHIFGLP